MTIKSGAAPSGSAFLVLNCADIGAQRVTCGQGLTAADKFRVWGALQTAAGGELNLQLLGILAGTDGNAIPNAPALTVAWDYLVFQRAPGQTGTGSGAIEAQGANSGRAGPVTHAVPTTPLAYSDPLDFSAAGEIYALGLDVNAAAGDVYLAWGTNDNTTRSPKSAKGATPLGLLKGAGGTPLIVSGYDLIILQCVTHSAATNAVGLADVLSASVGTVATAVANAGTATITAGQDVQTTAGRDITNTAARDVATTAGRNATMSATEAVTVQSGAAMLLRASGPSGDAISIVAGAVALPAPADGDIVALAENNIGLTATAALDFSSGTDLTVGAGQDLLTGAGRDFSCTPTRNASIAAGAALDVRGATSATMQGQTVASVTAVAGPLLLQGNDANLTAANGDAQITATNGSKTIILNAGSQITMKGAPVALEAISAPAGNPPAGHAWLYLDLADNKVKLKNTGGTVTPLN